MAKKSWTPIPNDWIEDWPYDAIDYRIVTYIEKQSSEFRLSKRRIAQKCRTNYKTISAHITKLIERNVLGYIDDKYRTRIYFVRPRIDWIESETERPKNAHQKANKAEDNDLPIRQRLPNQFASGYLIRFGIWWSEIQNGHVDYSVTDGESIRYQMVNRLGNRWSRITKDQKNTNLKDQERMSQLDPKPKSKTLVVGPEAEWPSGPSTFADVRESPNVSEQPALFQGFEDWEVSDDDISPPEAQNPSVNGFESVFPSQTPKKKKSSSKRYKYDLEDCVFAREWYAFAVQEMPNVKFNQDEWANQVRLLRERDGFTYDQLRAILEFVKKDSFWASNAISILGLRTKSGKNGLMKIQNIMANMPEFKRAKSAHRRADLDFSKPF